MTNATTTPTADQAMALARIMKRTAAKLDGLMTETGRLMFDQRAWVADEVADRLHAEALGYLEAL